MLNVWSTDDTSVSTQSWIKGQNFLTFNKKYCSARNFIFSTVYYTLTQFYISFNIFAFTLFCTARRNFSNCRNDGGFSIKLTIDCSRSYILAPHLEKCVMISFLNTGGGLYMSAVVESIIPTITPSLYMAEFRIPSGVPVMQNCYDMMWDQQSLEKKFRQKENAIQWSQ